MELRFFATKHVPLKWFEHFCHLLQVMRFWGEQLDHKLMVEAINFNSRGVNTRSTLPVVRYIFYQRLHHHIVVVVLHSFWNCRSG